MSVVVVVFEELVAEVVVDDEEEMESQDALEVAVKVKGMDPPMLISTNLFPNGMKGVKVILGSGQL